MAYNITSKILFFRSEVTRERHLEEPEVLVTGEDEMSEDEVSVLVTLSRLGLP